MRVIRFTDDPEQPAADYRVGDRIYFWDKRELKLQFATIEELTEQWMWARLNRTDGWNITWHKTHGWLADDGFFDGKIEKIHLWTIRI